MATGVNAVAGALDICLVSRILWPGGSQRILIAEGEELARRGHRVDIVFVRDTGQDSLRSTVRYRILHGPDSRDRAWGRLLRRVTARYGPERGPDATVDADLLWNFEGHRRRYDVLVYGDPWAALFARRGATKWGDRYWVHVHETSFGVHDFNGHNRVPRWLEGRALHGAAGILTSSLQNASALTLAGFGGVELLYPGTDPRTDVAGFDDREDVALSVTVWDPGRHPEAYLDLAAALPRGRIVLAGQWTDATALEKFRGEIERRRLTDRLEATGSISEEQLEALYRRAKVGIRFGYGEAGPGMGSLEGLGRGLPLVINPGVGVLELLVPGENCVLLPESDSAGLAKAITRLFEDSTEWSRLSRGSMKVAQERSWSDHGRRLEALLQSGPGRGRAPTA